MQHEIKSLMILYEYESFLRLKGQGKIIEYSLANLRTFLKTVYSSKVVVDLIYISFKRLSLTSSLAYTIAIFKS